MLTKEALSVLFPGTSLVAKVGDQHQASRESLSTSSDSEDEYGLPGNIYSKKFCLI